MNSKMKYKMLGDSGLKVSAISLGGWLTCGGSVQETQTYECMVKAFSLGINFFDNAEAYANGESERIFGRVFKKTGWKRSEFVVSTKVFWGGAAVNQCGLSRKHIVEAVKGACERMQLEYVDLVFAHRPDIHTPMEEIVRAFNYVIERGWAFYWGTSEWSAQEIQEAHMVARQYGLIPPIMEQPEYSMMKRDKVEKEYLPLMMNYKMGTTVWSPLAGGILSGKYLDAATLTEVDGRANLEGQKNTSEIDKKLIDTMYGPYFKTEEGRRKMQRIRELRDWLMAKKKEGAFKQDVTMAQLALAWVLHNPHVSTAIIGARKPEQIEENVKALDIRLTDAHMLEINKILQNQPEPERDFRMAM